MALAVEPGETHIHSHTDTYSWSISDSPGNRGCPSTSSPMMQPIAQTSTVFVYLFAGGSHNGGRRQGLLLRTQRGPQTPEHVVGSILCAS